VALPRFVSPTYDEMRDWWRQSGGLPEIERLILEVVRLRAAIRTLKKEADAARDAVYLHAPALTEPGTALGNFHASVAREANRSCMREAPHDRVEMYPLEISESRRRRQLRDGRR
jgi:hypothetical protein